MPRRQKQHHYIYKTTCQVTGKFYVGMHSTDELDDSYLGSGKILRYSILKHGVENHKKEILEHCPSREALKLREAEIVNEALLANPLNINLKYGGEGGGKIWSEEHRKKFVGSSRTAGLRGTQQAKDIAIKAQATKALRGSGVFPRCDWTGKSHRQETKDKMSSTMVGRYAGNKNPQFGTCWVFKDTAIKIKKDDLDQYISNGFVRGRKNPERVPPITASG